MTDEHLHDPDNCGRQPWRSAFSFGMTGLMFMILLMFGFTVSAKTYLNAMQAGFTWYAFLNLFPAIATFTPTNIMLLAIACAYFGMEWNKQPVMPYVHQWKQAMSIGVGATMFTLGAASYLDFQKVFNGDPEMYAKLAFATMVLAYRWGYNPDGIISWMNKQDGQPPSVQVTTQVRTETKVGETENVRHES